MNHPHTLRPLPTPNQAQQAFRERRWAWALTGGTSQCGRLASELSGEANGGRMFPVIDSGVDQRLLTGLRHRRTGHQPPGSADQQCDRHSGIGQRDLKAVALHIGGRALGETPQRGVLLGVEPETGGSANRRKPLPDMGGRLLRPG